MIMMNCICWIILSNIYSIRKPPYPLTKKNNGEGVKHNWFWKIEYTHFSILAKFLSGRLDWVWGGGGGRGGSSSWVPGENLNNENPLS